MAPNKSICAFPWNSIAVRPNGDAVPCCKFKNYLTPKRWGKLSDADVRNNQHWTDLRQQMLNGESVPECSACHQEEASGSASMRLDSLKEYTPTSIKCQTLTFLEISFSNLCNLACVSCNNYCSSRWGTEDYKHKRLKFPKVLLEHNVDLNMDLSQVRTVKIIGGEPFMEQRRFTELLKRLNLSQVSLWISTNGTVLPNDELRGLLDRCQEVTVHLSLDGINSVAEWYRWPTQFAEVTQVMDQYTAWWGNSDRVHLYTKTLINAYNVWDLNTVVDYVYNNYPDWEMYFDWIYQPSWQSVSVIPDKEPLEQQLKTWADTVKGRWNPRFGNPFLITVDRLHDRSASTWQELQKHTLALAQERNLDFNSMVPLCSIN